MRRNYSLPAVVILQEYSNTETLSCRWGYAIRDARYSQRFAAMAAFLLLLTGAFNMRASGAVDAYTTSVSDALNELAMGKTRESMACLSSALTVNSNDPLAHVAIGLSLLMGGRSADADAEFGIALELDGACAEACYGRGLVALQRGAAANAVALFSRAQRSNPNLDMRGAISYAKYTAGGGNTSGGETGDDEALLALEALQLMTSGRVSEAAAVWQRLQSGAMRPGFAERIGCSMTLVRAEPLVVTGWPLPSDFRPPSAHDGKLPAVSGKTVLRADLSKARNVSLVSFFVDERLVGITNRSPFEYVWDTSAVADGPHTVRTVGFDGLGATISEKSARVLVRNSGFKRECDRVSSPEAAVAWTKLWGLLRLKPAASAINYNLALCAAADGDTVSARAALERVMAADPGYLDTAARIGALRSAVVGPAIHGVTDAGRTIAITFDDGPKPETIRLLDVLKRSGIRATFFVVGKQADAHPSILRRMAAEGHDIQNHTYGHRALEFLSDREIEQELFRCAATVRSIVGAETTMIRPPGARHGKAFDELARRLGFRPVFWTMNCGSLEGTTRERMTKFVVSSAKPGAIVLMHNVDHVTLAALPDIIEALRQNGYSFATLSEMVARGRSRATGGKYGGQMQDMPSTQSKS